MAIFDAETGRFMSEREAYDHAIRDRISQLQHSIASRGFLEHLRPSKEEETKLQSLYRLQSEFHAISEKFERENRSLRASGVPEQDEATLRPEFVRALHAAQDEAATCSRPHDRYLLKDELRSLDKKLEAVQEHFEQSQKIMAAAAVAKQREAEQQPRQQQGAGSNQETTQQPQQQQTQQAQK